MLSTLLKSSDTIVFLARTSMSIPVLCLGFSLKKTPIANGAASGLTSSIKERYEIGRQKYFKHKNLWESTTVREYFWQLLEKMLLG